MSPKLNFLYDESVESAKHIVLYLKICIELQQHYLTTVVSPLYISSNFLSHFFQSLLCSLLMLQYHFSQLSPLYIVHTGLYSCWTDLQLSSDSLMLQAAADISRDKNKQPIWLADFLIISYRVYRENVYHYFIALAEPKQILIFIVLFQGTDGAFPLFQTLIDLLGWYCHLIGWVWYLDAECCIVSVGEM